MQLKVLGSSSSGNCYILENNSESLIIECGVGIMEIKKALDFKISKVAACIISHQHGDHSKSIADVISCGISVISGKEVFQTYGIPISNINAKLITNGKGFKAGNFKILPFALSHDVVCHGFQIDHPETGRIIFITDSYLCEYCFENVNHWLIECNYADDILENNIQSGRVHPSMRPRLLSTHMVLETAKGILLANDLSGVINIVLVHLSDGNSNEERFIREIRECTGKAVYAAKKGLTIDFNKVPY